MSQQARIIIKANGFFYDNYDTRVGETYHYKGYCKSNIFIKMKIPHLSF